MVINNPESNLLLFQKHWQVDFFPQAAVVQI